MSKPPKARTVAKRLPDLVEAARAFGQAIGALTAILPAAQGALAGLGQAMAAARREHRAIEVLRDLEARDRQHRKTT